MKTSVCVLVCSIAAMASLGAQQKSAPAAPKAAPSANPITDSIKANYTTMKGYVTKSAAAVPAKGYIFKPAGVAAEVRNFGQIVGHLANANYMFCAPLVGEAMAGERGPGGADYEKIAGKADLEKALAASFEYCDKAFAAVNDRNAAEPVTGLPTGPTTKIGALAINNGHVAEHYGNFVTYMRAMGMVPPSSQPAR